jgi:hypothetical protein
MNEDAMSGNALILVVASLIAVLGLLVQGAERPSDEPSLGDAGATAALGDDPVTVAVLCGGIHL